MQAPEQIRLNREECLELELIETRRALLQAQLQNLEQQATIVAAQIERRIGGGIDLRAYVIDLANGVATFSPERAAKLVTQQTEKLQAPLPFEQASN